MQTIQLGIMDLYGNVYGPFTPSGGYFDIKQDGATSLRTGARKGDPKGFSLKFSVCFQTEASASDFLAYVAAFAPDAPDFDEDAGADIPLYIRGAEWHYNVYSVVVKPEPISKEVMDHIQYQYEVICYCYSPYSDGAAQVLPATYTHIDAASDGSIILLTAAGQILAYYSSAWHDITCGFSASLCTIGGPNYIYAISADDGYVYHYAAGVWTLLSEQKAFRISCNVSGSLCAVRDPDRIPINWTGSAWNALGSEAVGYFTSGDALVCAIKVSDSKPYYWSGGAWNSLGSISSVTAIDSADPSALFMVSGGKMYHYSGTWDDAGGANLVRLGVISASLVYAIDTSGVFWTWNGTTWSNPAAPQSLDNSDGHIASAPDLTIVASYNSGRAEDLTVAIADGLSLILADQCNSAETWELEGNEYKLFQTYEDAITAGTQWGRDWIGSGTFDTDHMELDNGESAYIILSGPHQAKKPIKMTADLSLDSGGATGEATVDISPDGVAWQTVLDQDDFESGSAEYVLQGSEYMTDIYVRISCNSGTSGKKVNIGSIKFEVERWIEDGAVPVVAAGETKVPTVSATGGAIAVTGSFTPRRKFL